MVSGGAMDQPYRHAGGKYTYEHPSPSIIIIIVDDGAPQMRWRAMFALGGWPAVEGHDVGA